MTEQFKEQGGAATMDPSPVVRWITSRVMTRLCRPDRLTKERARVEKARIRAGEPHVVEYFHQIEDAYSHLAAQVLPALLARYDVQLVCHLVTGPSGKNVPEPELLPQLSRYDAFHIADGYGLDFPRHDEPLQPEPAALATAILAGHQSIGFAECAARVGRALWADDLAGLADLAAGLGRVSQTAINERVAAGNARREQLKHYSGAMFYYGNEWYWGVDRLYHLEQRLADLGLDRDPGKPLLMPRPVIAPALLKDTKTLTLEVFPSLRSPYTAISFDRSVALARDTGVNLVVRPVLPMVMRGAPITRQKGMYIFSDTAREARAAGVPFGHFCDPIGNPVRRAYSLLPWAAQQGKDIEFISAFLRCAFAEGVNTNSDRGMRKVVEEAGLDWSAARAILGQPGWENALEENRLAMYRSGLWGVPSYRLLDESGSQLLSLWGQDRLWVFAREIQRQLAARQ
jgi:2-hydroxychromene-2-carboxylate isomerase